jgi:hypothetical protein
VPQLTGLSALQRLQLVASLRLSTIYFDSNLLGQMEGEQGLQDVRGLGTFDPRLEVECGNSCAPGIDCVRVQSQTGFR